jgi:UDP-N-acetylglucosamine 2-epimerase (non-hydrolysing)
VYGRDRGGEVRDTGVRTREGSMHKNVLVVYGTRPEAIKLAPVVRALRGDPDLHPVVAVTGQHRGMLDQVNGLFGIEPDIDLDLMIHGASINAITRAVLEYLEPVLAEVRPQVVVVQGDTTSAFGASYAAFVAGHPVVHVEAGLRTGQPRSPFPEETNRRLTSVLADLHLAPTTAAHDNLVSEGADPRTVLVTGNTVIDALHWVVSQPAVFSDPALAGLGIERELVLVTAHRRESWGERMRDAMLGLRDVAEGRSETDFLLPMHPNPVVRDVIVEVLGDLPNVVLTEPLAYAEFAHLLGRARLVVTDSGGVQEEAPGLGKPVLVLRETTERPEGVEAGVVRLIGTDRGTVAREVERLLTDSGAHAAMARAVNPYGDGHASERSHGAIRALLGLGVMPQPFVAGSRDARSEPAISVARS